MRAKRPGVPAGDEPVVCAVVGNHATSQTLLQTHSLAQPVSAQHDGRVGADFRYETARMRTRRIAVALQVCSWGSGDRPGLWCSGGHTRRCGDPDDLPQIPGIIRYVAEGQIHACVLPPNDYPLLRPRR